MKKIKEIKTSFGGPCIYRRAIFEDGTQSGHIQDIGQSQAELEEELLASDETGRDDVMSFIAGI